MATLSAGLSKAFNPHRYRMPRAPATPKRGIAGESLLKIL